MLKKDLNYICFDFETTGLDIEKDEAIQIGIIKFNHKFEITEQFSSYIKPQNFDQINKLAEIVEFTTGINPEQIKNAPLFSQIKEKIKNFFNKKSVLIGHNIDFDINFLTKYIPEIEFYEKFDTYIYSRLLLHFEPSYALEILADKYNFKKKAHDALEDSIMSMELFKILIKKVEKLIKKYPVLSNILQKSNSIFSKILILPENNQKLFSIPKSKLQILKPKKLNTNLPPITTYPPKSVFNINNISIEEALSFAINKQNKIVLSFSSNARANCAKKILKEKYIPVSSLNLWFTISEENEKKLLNKEKLEEFESLYILKAFSHYNESLPIFDISNFNESKVYNFLAEEKRWLNSNIIITTHQELFEHIKTTDNLKNYLIIFFDWHNWASSLSKVINKWFDFYDFIKKLEIIKYKLSFEKKEEEIENLINQISTFFWILSIKIQPLFKWTNNKIEVINLINEPKNWLNQLKDAYVKLNILVNETLKNPEYKELLENWKVFTDSVENYCIIEQKIVFWWNLKYIFHPLMENIDIHTFNDFMKDYNYYCFTTMEKWDYIQLEWKSKENKLRDLEKNLDFKKLVEEIKEKIENNESIYLISNNKNFSTNLFKLIFNLFKEYNLTGNIYAENITGWQGKLLYYLSKDKWPKITIWWPEFLIQNIAKNISYKNYWILALQWKNKNILVKDLEFYLK